MTFSYESPRLAAADAWLGARRRLVAVVLAVIALGLRLGYLADLHGGPHVHQQLADNFDMQFFSLWAERIAGGDLLSIDDSDPERPLHPLHEWHRRVGLAYLQGRPLAANEFQQLTPAQFEACRKLWYDWYGGPRLHQEPVYPYAIALTYALFGNDLEWVYAWQILLGTLTVVLIHALGARYFGDLTGTLAGALAVLCGPLMAYDLVLLRVTLITFAGLGIVWLTERQATPATRRGALLCGAALGFAFLVKSTFVLLVPAVLLRVAGRPLGRWRAFGLSSLPVVLGFLALLLPLFVRNLVAGAPIASTSSVAAVTFAASNSAFYNGFGFDPPTNSVAQIMAESHGALLPTVWATLATHDLSSFVHQLWDKFAKTWHWYEVWNNVNYYYLRELSPVLGLLPVTFFVLSPLSAIGLVLAARRRKEAALLYWLVVVCAIPLLAFYVLSRFRIPLVAALIPFAAFTIVQLLDWIAARKVGPALATIAALVVFSLWSMQPLREGTVILRPSEFVVALNEHYKPKCEAALAAKDPATALRLADEALAMEPELVRGLHKGRDARNHTEAIFAGVFGYLHGLRSDALSGLGRAEQARSESQRASELLRIRNRFAAALKARK